ncbi:MAG TPA: DinB family protein [Vicinamibacterales bacterium]|nr:DinB family protein [Vicinamibacterales bacterium]
MTSYSTQATVAALMERELENVIQEIELFPDDELLWATVPGVSNSSGNLALHLAGNLQHFVGAQIGATGYVRDRPREFSQRSGTRADVVAEVRRAIDVVRRVVPALTDEQWRAPYAEPVGGVPQQTGPFLMHLASHAAFHLGQMGYLRRTLTGKSESTNPVAPRVLAEKLG